jgi:hypothetical protein
LQLSTFVDDFPEAVAFLYYPHEPIGGRVFIPALAFVIVCVRMDPMSEIAAISFSPACRSTSTTHFFVLETALGYLLQRGLHCSDTLIVVVQFRRRAQARCSRIEMFFASANTNPSNRWHV